jgi:PKD repeat protein
MNKICIFRPNALSTLTLFALTAILFTIVIGLSGANNAGAALSGGDVDTEAECRWCHCPQPGDSPLYMPNRHHGKIGKPIPGSTISETYNCTTAACHKLEWNPTLGANEFVSFRDCISCHTSNPVPGHHEQTTYECMQCHEMRWMPASNSFGTVLMNWCGGSAHPAYDPPVAKAGDDQNIIAGQTVVFDGSTSYDPELGAELTYEWDFGDNSPRAWGKTQSHVYPLVGTYEARLTVYNYACNNDPCTLQRCGTPCLSGSDQVLVKTRQDFSNLVAPVASVLPASATTAPGTAVTFDLSGTRDPDGTITFMSLDFGDNQRIDSPPAKVAHTYTNPGNYTAKLTVYDDDGQMSPASVAVNVVAPPPPPPPVLPAAPACLASSGRTSSTISLKWSDKSTNEQGFYVERSPNLSTPVWTRIATLASNSTTYRVSGLNRGTTYKFRVLAYNSAGTAASNVLTAATYR